MDLSSAEEVFALAEDWADVRPRPLAELTIKRAVRPPGLFAQRRATNHDIRERLAAAEAAGE